MNVQQEIINAIDVMVQKYMNTTVFGQDVATVVIDIKDSKYKVVINGSEYWVKDGVKCAPKKGTGVWVRIPSGKGISSAFIEGLR